MIRKRQQGRNILLIAFIVNLAIAALYLLVVIQTQQIPRSRELYGHSMGILGFVLMLVTEIAYSLRKRSPRARWGRMADWLDFHIFTGLVGPFMVLLHSSWKFNGLAGVVMLLTVVIVISGFIGRYIFTSIPRSVDGAVLERRDIELAIANLDGALRSELAALPPQEQARLQKFTESIAHIGRKGSFLLTGFHLARLRWRGWWLGRRASPASREQIQQITALEYQRITLNRQIHTLDMARELMALWHAVHVPIGMALFLLAFVHIGGAIYYASLLR